MPDSPPRLFAVVPAAGHSRRMGRPKLLLPLHGRTVISWLLQALALPEIIAVAVIVRRDDVALRDEVARLGGWAVSPDIDPPDMRASVEFGLRCLEERFTPADDDGWLLVPADHPVLDRGIVAELTAAWLSLRPKFLVPTYNGRRGHPLLARWDTVSTVFALPADQGLNRLLHNHAEDVVTVPVANSSVVIDLDVPEDYERLRRERS